MLFRSRPGNRDAMLYIITDVNDNVVSGNYTPLYGHYVWKITLKRYINTFEEGSIPNFGEEGSMNVHHDEKMGMAETYAEIPENKEEPFDVGKYGQEEIFDQQVNGLDQYYGKYYR